MSYKESYESFREPTSVRAELIVRPDLLRVAFSVSLELTEGVDPALSVLQRACEQLHRRFQDALGPGVTLRPRNVRFDRSALKKLAMPDEEATHTAVEGLFEVPLPSELDFWARSSRVATLARLCHAALGDSRQSKKLPRFSFGNVEALVAQPEAHRTELLRRSVTRARELASTVGSPEAPLHVVDCSAPGPVEQSPASLEEVGLSLHVHCRLGVVHAPGRGEDRGGTESR
ncbi:hypothetical protein F0U61_48950 [Archangium violaceum]|uniref:hypothetical protein n=1 Tax=Archangium violaceum TaxID=83451 RepID=UPI002B31C63B|nr:hypothetical protein F0U61_48950 [Archangium violaceum]